MLSARVQFAVLALAAGLIAVLPASAAADPVAEVAKTPKAKATVTQVSTPFLLPFTPTENADGAATCPAGTTLLSGGALANTPESAGPPLLAMIFKSGPSGNSWAVRYENRADVTLQPSAQAICLKDRLKVTGADRKPKAITRVTQVNTPFTVPADTLATNQGKVQFDVACPAGTTIAGGGASFGAAALDPDVQLFESGPQGNGWHVRYNNNEDIAYTGIASALCLKSKLKVRKGDLGKDKARSKFEQVDQGVSLPPVAINSGRSRFTVLCPEGTTIVGGGGKISPAAPLATTDISLEESGAVGNAWQVLFQNFEDTAQSASVHALCLKNKLKVK